MLQHQQQHHLYNHYHHQQQQHQHPTAPRRRHRQQQHPTAHRHHRCRSHSTNTTPTSTANATATAKQQRRQMMPVQPLRSDEVWYLGYGSNMSPQTLTGRRRVKPQQSLPCFVPGYSLSFGMQGFPWSEPGFATIEQVPQAPAAAECLSPSSWRTHAHNGTPCLHAVLHRVTQQEWESIKASEGVFGSSSGANSSVGYNVVEVDCVLYDDATVLRAVTLQGAAASLHHSARPVQPSARYLRLLQDGSRHHDLDRHYQQWLLRLQPYQPPSTLTAAVGASISSAVLLSAASTALPAYIVSRAFGSSSSSARQQSAPPGEASAGPAQTSSGEQQPQGQESSNEGAFLPFLRQYTSTSQSLMWDVADNLQAWLGSGSSVTKQP